MATLTDKQQELLRWIVQSVEEGLLDEEFHLLPTRDGCILGLADGRNAKVAAGRGLFDVLAKAGYLHGELTNAEQDAWTYNVLGNAQKAVASNFAEPLPPAPAQTFATTITGGTGFQFGNHNQMTVQMAAETITQAINHSTASPEKKEEVKGKWAKFWGDEATKTVLETLVGGAVKGLKE